MAIQRTGRDMPRLFASAEICVVNSRRFAAVAARLPKNGTTAGETTVMPSSVVRASLA
jgi:hypothetical protein